MAFEVGQHASFWVEAWCEPVHGHSISPSAPAAASRLALSIPLPSRHGGTDNGRPGSASRVTPITRAPTSCTPLATTPKPSVVRRRSERHRGFSVGGGGATLSLHGGGCRHGVLEYAAGLTMLLTRNAAAPVARPGITAAPAQIRHCAGTSANSRIDLTKTGKRTSARTVSRKARAVKGLALIPESARTLPQSINPTST